MLTAGRPRKRRRQAPCDYRKPLNEREQQFVDAFLVNPEPKAAALLVGYSGTYGTVLLNKPNVANAIRRRMKDASEKADVKAEDLLIEYQRLAYANMGDFLEEDEITGLPRFKRFSDLSRKQLAAVSEMTIDTEVEIDPVVEGKEPTTGRRVTRIKFKLHDKRQALRDLAQYMKLFGDLDRNGNGNGHTTNNTIVIVQDALSATDGIIERIINGAALGLDPGAVPGGPVLPADLHPAPAGP